MNRFILTAMLVISTVVSTTVLANHHIPVYHHHYCDATHLSRRTIYLVDRLEGYADYKEYGTYLLPIKKVAGRTLAAAQAYGNLSHTVRQWLYRLKNQIEYSRPYLEHAFEISNAFYLAMDLVSVGDELDHCLY